MEALIITEDQARKDQIPIANYDLKVIVSAYFIAKQGKLGVKLLLPSGQGAKMKIPSHRGHDSTMGSECYPPFHLHKDKLFHTTFNEYNSQIPLFCPSLQKDKLIRV